MVLSVSGDANFDDSETAVSSGQSETIRCQRIEIAFHDVGIELLFQYHKRELSRGV